MSKVNLFMQSVPSAFTVPLPICLKRSLSPSLYFLYFPRMVLSTPSSRVTVNSVCLMSDFSVPLLYYSFAPHIHLEPQRPWGRLTETWLQIHTKHWPSLYLIHSIACVRPLGRLPQDFLLHTGEMMALKVSTVKIKWTSLILQWHQSMHPDVFLCLLMSSIIIFTHLSWETWSSSRSVPKIRAKNKEKSNQVCWNHRYIQG